MPRLPCSLLCALCALVFNLLGSAPAGAQALADAAAHAAAIAPFIDDHTLAIGHLDLKQLDASAAMKLLADAAPEKTPELTQRLAQWEQQAKGVLTALSGAGIGDLYVVISLSDVPQGPPFIVAPLKAGARAETATQLLGEITGFSSGESIGGAAVAGSAETLARLKTLKPAPRPELRRAFELAGNSTAQLIFWPSEDTRRVLREMLPRLPDELGGGSGKMLAEGIQWGVVWADAPPQLKLAAVVQSKDADAASALRGMIVSSLQYAGKQEGVQQNIPQFGQLAALLTPRLAGDQLKLALSERETVEQALKLLAAPVQAMRIAAGRNQSQNNLKQLAVAMHNHHDVHKQFPPQAVRSAEGKPLLSWRVALLPYLGQQALYDQFHLDEPWDSEHNKPLVLKMPAVFASPNLGDALIAKGMTSYLAPLSHQPPAVALIDMQAKPAAEAKDQMVFDLPHGTKMAQISDGTSNTIMIVEAEQQSAVPWTKPADLVIDERAPLRGLKNQPNNGFSAAFCDGSARFISNNVDATVFWNLLRMNDGNPVGEF